MRRMRLRRLGAAWALFACVAAGAGASAQQPEDWHRDVSELLARRARAVERGDLSAFTATMRGAPRPFVDARAAWFRRLRSLPLAAYRLELFDGGFGDLAADADRRRYGPDTHVVQAKERIGFRGYDRTGTYEDLYLTVRKDATGWSVVSDTDRESLFLLSMRNMWDFGPVEAIQRGGIMVIVHPAQRGVAEGILTAAQRARATAKARWPYPWSDPIVIMVPSIVPELERILQTQFDLSSFVAFAAASEDRTAGWALTGFRVYLHWPNFSRYDATFQQTILEHELTHIASFNRNSVYMPSFMDEGVAQYYGENAGYGQRPQERAAIRNGTFDRRLPPDWHFYAGTQSQIFLAYEKALSFSAYLGDRFGRTAAARLFTAISKENPVAAGTSHYHVSRAFRSTFGASLAELERAWAAHEIAALR